MELVTIAIQSGMNSDAAGNFSDALDEAREVSSRCKCLPSCTSIEYEAETSQADYDWRAIYRAYRLNISDEMNEWVTLPTKQNLCVRSIRNRYDVAAKSRLGPLGQDFWKHNGHFHQPTHIYEMSYT